MKRFLATLALVALSGLGCQKDMEKTLGLVYSPPTVPADVPERYGPPAGSRDCNWLKPGETHLNLKEEYLDGHKFGWKMALDDWFRWRKFHYATREELQWDTFKSTEDAMWLGYDDARRAIEEATGTNSSVPPAP